MHMLKRNDYYMYEGRLLLLKEIWLCGNNIGAEGKQLLKDAWKEAGKGEDVVILPLGYFTTTPYYNLTT